MIISQLEGLDTLASAEYISLGSPQAVEFVQSYVDTVRFNLPSTDPPMFLYFQNSGRVFGKTAEEDSLENGTITEHFRNEYPNLESIDSGREEGACAIIHDPNMDFARFVYVREIYPPCCMDHRYGRPAGLRGTSLFLSAGRRADGIF